MNKLEELKRMLILCKQTRPCDELDKSVVRLIEMQIEELENRKALMIEGDVEGEAIPIWIQPISIVYPDTKFVRTVQLPEINIQYDNATVGIDYSDVDWQAECKVITGQHDDALTKIKKLEKNAIARFELFEKTLSENKTLIEENNQLIEMLNRHKSYRKMATK